MKGTITVVGLGKIGLPLAVQFARKGYYVLGADIDSRVVNLVNQGVEPFPGERDLSLYLREVVKKGTLRAVSDTKSAVSESDFIVVVVPLYVTRDGVPDFKSLDEATSQIGAGLKKNTLVSYETTLPVGTTRNRFAKALENISGLIPGKDFNLVFSPERVFTGRVFADLRRYPKLVGGFDRYSEIKAVEFYSSVLDFDFRTDLIKPNGVWPMGSSEAAEFAKLAETTYRDVNIALANQFSLFAEKLDIEFDTIIQASNSQPFSHLHKPGIAVGGHCIPIYPQMYLWNDPLATLVLEARKINSEMPMTCVKALRKMHGTLKNQRVVVLGASYRGGVKEFAFSGVFRIVELLIDEGAEVFVQDPMYSETELHELGFQPFVKKTLVDAIIVQADHGEYKSLSKVDFPGVRTVFDGRGILNKSLWKGLNFHAIGSGQITSEKL